MEDRQERLDETIEVIEASGKKRFAKGVMAGVLSTVCVFLAVGAFCYFWLWGRVSIGGSGASGQTASGSIVNNSVKAKINELTSIIRDSYYEDVDSQTLTDGLYKGLFDSLEDPYSEYYTREEYEEMMISASAQYYGIGAVLQQDPDTMQVTVKRIYEDTPAEQAGLKVGDMIVKVGDIDSRTMELSELVTHIRGEEKTKVHLQVGREGESGYLEFDIRRAKVDLPTVMGEMLEDHVGYIMIAEFGKATAKDFEDTVEELGKKGMEKLIIDLRDNPGGMLDSVCEILDYILPEGLIVYTEDKYGNRQEQFSDEERSLDYPMAVLINGNSASCSEIFAGAVRDYDYGVLIGTTTYGKGVVQSVRPLSDKSAIKLTTARYFTPKGENIHGTGIAPDIELEYHYGGDLEGEFDYTKDNQIARAVRELTK